ncbi:MAG: hypothetical protein H0V82_12195 [Candidatus Protochlamydia sp.]|nr:hypothetical protein [Candidatus Protochlamydia sp.]
MSYSLSTKSVEHINNSQKELSQIRCRVLPMGTEDLRNQGHSYTECKKLSKSIASAFSKEGYQIHVAELKKLLMIDLLNSDIPLFTKKDDIIYVGYDKPIGERKKKEMIKINLGEKK